MANKKEIYELKKKIPSSVRDKNVIDNFGLLNLGFNIFYFFIFIVYLSSNYNIEVFTVILGLVPMTIFLLSIILSAIFTNKYETVNKRL